MNNSHRKLNLKLGLKGKRPSNLEGFLEFCDGREGDRYHPKGTKGLLSRPVHGEFPWSPNRCAHTKQYLTQNFNKTSERITPRKSKKRSKTCPY